MALPKITRSDAMDRVPHDQFVTLQKNGFISKGVFVIAFRGYYLDTMGKPGVNDRGIYDDCMCVVTPEEFYTYNANTDPSRLTPNIATLVPGLHYFKKGKHGITTHSDGGYLAFRPATPDESLPVWRDGHGYEVFKGIAINLHKGGYKTTSSAGCQTVHPDQWNDFQTRVYSLMTKYKQDTLPYDLVVWTN